MIKNLIFDFNVEVMMSDEEMHDRMMVSVKHCMDTMSFPCTLHERGTAFWGYQRQYYKEFRAFPEIKAILEKSVSLGKKNYIYTHSGDVVCDILKNMGLDGYFLGMVTADHGFPLKPAPDALLYLCKTYDVDPAQSIMIGDRDIDTMAGNNAGMQGCLWDSRDYYADYQTDYKIKTLDELYELLDRI